MDDSIVKLSKLFPMADKEEISELLCTYTEEEAIDELHSKYGYSTIFEPTTEGKRSIMIANMRKVYVNFEDEICESILENCDYDFGKSMEIAKDIQVQCDFSNERKQFVQKMVAKNEQEAENDDITETTKVKKATKHGPTSYNGPKAKKPRQSHPKGTHEIDLHGYDSAHAIAEIRDLINVYGCKKEIGYIRFITGRGNNSPGNVPILKPYALQTCKLCGKKAYVDRSNIGVVICDLYPNL